MKGLLLACALILDLLANGQKKGDNAVLLPAYGITIKKIQSVLITSGYAIDKVMDNYIITSPVPHYKNASYINKVAASIEDSIVTIQSWFQTASPIHGHRVRI